MPYAHKFSGRRLAELFKSWPFLWGALLACVYLVSRLYAVTHVPIFIDEAIHVDWGRATAESFPPYNLIYDGKWLSIKIFALASSLRAPFDDLIASRLSVVALGLTAALACYLAGRDLFSRRAGALAAAVYVALPFTVLYNSLALTDGVQMAFGAWAVFLSARLAQTRRWLYVLTLPLALVAAVLAKFSGVVLLGLPLAAVLLLAPPARWAGGALRAAPALLAPLGLFALFYSLGMLQTLQANATVARVSLREQAWVNLLLAGEWLWGLLTPSVAVVASAAVVWLLTFGRSRAGLFVVAVLGITVLPYVVLSQVWFPRYLLAAVIPVSLAVGSLLDGVAARMEELGRGRRVLAGAALPLLVICVLSWPVLRSGTVLFALPAAEIPAPERFQFVEGWPSGYGVRELADFLRAQGEATPGGVLVARTNWADHPLQSLNIYLTQSPSLSLYTIGDESESSVKYLTYLNTKRRTLLVLITDHGVPRRVREAGAPLLTCGRPVWSYTRPGGATGFVVLELDCGGLTFSK
jgi:hypothetical protein